MPTFSKLSDALNCIFKVPRFTPPLLDVSVIWCTISGHRESQLSLIKVVQLHHEL